MEYDDSVLVQCDGCGVTVHTQCYGLSRDCGAAVGGDLWLCDVCALMEKGLKVRARAATCVWAGGCIRVCSSFCACVHCSKRVELGLKARVCALMEEALEVRVNTARLSARCQWGLHARRTMHACARDGRSAQK